jgi:hypothetical protein
VDGLDDDGFNCYTSSSFIINHNTFTIRNIAAVLVLETPPTPAPPTPQEHQ